MPGQRLLAQLDLFANPEVVLDDTKYWNPEFARHFIESWDAISYDDAEAGFRLAEVAVTLVSLLDEEAQAVLRPRALATLGSSYRALGDLPQAEEILGEVANMHSKILVPRLDEADYLRRMAYLRMDQRRWTGALEFAAQTILLCKAEQAEHDAGRAYGAQGAVYLSMVLSGSDVPDGEPILSLSEALKRIDPRRGLDTYEAPMCNLALALLEGFPCDLELTLSTLKRALRIHAYRRITRKSLPNAHLRWTIGIVYLRIGSADFLHRAIQILRRARRRLMDLGVPDKVVQISIDLGRAYYALGRWGHLRLVAEEILRIDRTLNRDALAAIQAWHAAILRERIPKTVWEKVEEIRWSSVAVPEECHCRPITFTPRPSSPPPLW